MTTGTDSQSKDGQSLRRMDNVCVLSSYLVSFFYYNFAGLISINNGPAVLTSVSGLKDQLVKP